MTETVMCELCKTPMTKTGSMNSANSQFLQFVCKSCWQQKTVCTGLKTL